MTSMRTVNLGGSHDSPPKQPPHSANGPGSGPNTGNTGTTEAPGSGPGSGPSTAPPRTPAIRKLETQIRDFYQQFGTYAGMMMPDPFVGSVIAQNAEPLSAAWADLAAQDPNVKRTLERILSGGSWAAVVGGHAVGIVLPILAYHNRLPEQAQSMILGVTLAMASAEGGNPVIRECIQRKFTVNAE